MILLNLSAPTRLVNRLRTNQVASLIFLDQAELSDPMVTVQRSSHLSQATDALHMHNYEGSEEA